MPNTGRRHARFRTPVAEFRGYKAAYTQAERRIVEQLPGDEQAVIHLLKAFTQGRISEPKVGSARQDQRE